MTFAVDVRDSPAKVIGALVDFSDRRPQIWPNLTARLFTVHELGDGTAEVTEGTAIPGLEVWERLTYEWTDSTVRAVITDGKIYKPGGLFEVRVEPNRGGSRVWVTFDRRPKNLLGWCIGSIMQLTRGAPIKRSIRQVHGK